MPYSPGARVELGRITRAPCPVQLFVPDAAEVATCTATVRDLTTDTVLRAEEDVRGALHSATGTLALELDAYELAPRLGVMAPQPRVLTLTVRYGDGRAHIVEAQFEVDPHVPPVGG